MIKFPVPAFPKFTRNRILTVILLIGISLTAAGIVLAAAPNPGHMWSELSGDGLAQGDIPYGSALNTLSKLAKDANATRYLSNTGATNNPAWAQVNVANGITGTVGTANLGSGTANSTTFLRGDQTWAAPTASVAWGAITGTLSSQTDLNTALGLKEVTANKNASGGYPGLSGVNLQVYNTGGTVLSNFITSATTPRTYTFPDVSGNVLTSGAAVTVAQGGTGLGTLTTNNVILGAGTSNVTFVAPGTTGNLLQSNGTTWVSGAAPAASGLPKYNQSVTSTAAGFAADTYLVGSSIAIVAPATTLKIGSRYHMIFNVSKTAAGVATPTLTIRYGTLGTTGDASKCALTFTAQTGVTDTGTFEVWSTFRTIGAGTAAVLQCVGQRRHGASITGFGTLVSETKAVTSAGFDSTVANSIIGTSVNGGASAAWTVTLVQAELENIN